MVVGGDILILDLKVTDYTAQVFCSHEGSQLEVDTHGGAELRDS